jgi:hypothetical protein
MILTKQINHWPDIASDEAWQTYNIALARVISVSEKDGRTYIQHRVEQQFSDGKMEQVSTAPLHHYWFGMYTFEPPSLRANELIVIYYRKEHAPCIVTQKLTRPPAQSPLVKELATIARLRASAGQPNALIDGGLSTDSIVSLYSLRRMMMQPQPPSRVGFAKALRKARDDDKRPAAVRVLASQLANKVEGKPLASDEEYAWVQSALMRSTESDWTRLRPFTERLIGLGRRPQTAELLAEMVKNANLRQPLRMAAYATFHDPRLFVFERPDAPSEQLFAACVEMLKDSDPVIRAAGASLLHHLSTRIAQPVRARYIARAKEAIQVRARLERDRAVRFHMRNSLDLFDRVPAG